MPKVQFAPDIESISGKLCKNKGVVYSVNRRTGKTYRSERHGYADANTEAQQAHRAEFKTKSQFSAQWWNTNKASNSDAFIAVMKAYKAQNKIGNPYSYLRCLVTDDLKVILAGKDLTGGIVPNTPSQDTDTDNGGGTRE